MAWIGSSPNQTAQRTDGVRTGTAVHADQKTAGVKIRADLTDVELNDIVEMIDACMKLDGGNIDAQVPLNGNNFDEVGNAAARDEFASAGQIADGALIYAGTSAGTDTITATLSPAITAYVAGQRYHFKAGGTNAGAATVNFNTVGAKDIKKGAAGSTALAAGDITIGGMYTVEYDGTNMQLLNPGTQNVTITAAGAALLDDADAGAQRTTLGIDATDDVTFGSLTCANASGVEGGQLNLAKPASGTSIAGTNVIVDIAVNSLRVFEDGGGFRGMVFDLTTMSNGAASVGFHSGIVASQATMEAGSNIAVPVAPGRQHFHPSAAKAWANINFPAGVPTIDAGYNVSSVADGGVGICQINYTNFFSSALYAPLVSNYLSATGLAHVASFTSGNVTVHSRNTGGTLQDPFGVMLAAFGDL